MRNCRRPRRSGAGALLLLLLGALALAWAVRGGGRAQQAPGGGLFSWSDRVLEGEARDRLFADMAACGLTQLYQHVPGDAEPERVRAFLRAAAERGVAVYLLTGDPDWGLDPSGGEMAAQAARCADYNRGLPGWARLRGVVMDAEPYLTQAWEEDPAGTMAAYVSGMRAARAAAGRAGLQYVACIPWFYDTKGLEAELEELITSGCGGLAIMNYQKRDEAGQIETEVSMARAAGVPVTVIYELQAPGSHDLTGHNTYHEDGLEAVAESFRALEARFGADGLRPALHDYRALEEVLARE